MIKHYNEIDSTNSELRRLISKGEAEDFLAVMADFQTAGRGQVGNHWESEPYSNLLLSVLLRPACLDVRQQYMLSMAISSAIQRALSRYVNDVKIKWPNDVYVGDKKLAGILIENSLRGTLIADSIMGIGVNVNQTKFVSDAPNPVSVKMITSRNNDPADVASAIIAELRTAMQLVDTRAFQSIVDDYMRILYRYDSEMHPFSDDKGRFMARISHIEPDGHLHLIDEHGQDRCYAFKEVEFII